MDIQMPEMDGLQACMYIKNEMGIKVPIIGLTANNVEDEREKWTEAGMDSCMSKPFEPAELCNLIEQILQK